MGGKTTFDIDLKGNISTFAYRVLQLAEPSAQRRVLSRDSVERVALLPHPPLPFACNPPTHHPRTQLAPLGLSLVSSGVSTELLSTTLSIYNIIKAFRIEFFVCCFSNCVFWYVTDQWNVQFVYFQSREDVFQKCGCTDKLNVSMP